MSNIKIAFETLGCKLNQAETELLAGQLAEAGCQIVSPEDKADIYILNTCTVTHVADRKSRHLLRMAHARNPEARVVALGCYAARDSEALSRVEGLDLVVGNEEKANLKKILEEAGYLRLNGSRNNRRSFGRTRSFIKAQDGCNNFCTYCIVPLVRGREKNLPAEQVISNIQGKVIAGYQEVVLTGTEIGRYQDSGLNLQSLLKRILEETGIRRLRLSSLQPQEINSDFLQLWQDARLCRHFHLSLQSGSESVLKRMNRQYTPGDYSEKVNLIREALPEVAITTDIIVGFPGETEKEFQESREFCRRMAFARIHVFAYSAREGTKAAGMPGQVEPRIKKQRSEQMISLSSASSKTFQERFLGQTQDVLFEQSTGSHWSGFTSNYIKVYCKNKNDLTNRIVPVKLISLSADGIEGEVNGGEKAC